MIVETDCGPRFGYINIIFDFFFIAAIFAGNTTENDGFNADGINERHRPLVLFFIAGFDCVRHLCDNRSFDLFHGLSPL